MEEAELSVVLVTCLKLNIQRYQAGGWPPDPPDWEKGPPGMSLTI